MPGATFTIKVDLGKTATLDPWAKALLQKARTAMQEVFSQGLGTVKANERVKTGNMRNSTTHNNKHSTTNTNTSTGASIIASAGYSGFQNFGTRYMSGTHFIEAGVSQITSALPARLNELLAI